jgi:threonine synthase
MQFVSTRGRAPALAFDEVLLTGLAADGGLYLPAAWPRFGAQQWRRLAGLGYVGLAHEVLRPFLAGSVVEPELPALLEEAYAGFGHRAVAPLVQLDRDLWLLELFHGPTLAFKDVALQLLGRLFERVLALRGERLTIVGATSGDTGSAAIEACRDRPGLEVVMLHPQGRTSEVQRRQMTTVAAANVTNVAIEGSFDDCQDLVKALFADEQFRRRHRLAAVNSINCARILAQTVYYCWAALALGAPEREIVFAVPSGNFGNVYAGYVARQLGLPVAGLVAASNRNDILTRFFRDGRMELGTVEPSLSPSMDIQVSSNLERLLFDVFERDGAATAGAMTEFRRNGRLALSAERMVEVRSLFSGGSLSDEATLAEIRRVYEETGEIVDPHTAVGIAVARRAAPQFRGPKVVLATAHPAKFPDAVERAIGIRPALPPRLADLYERPERCETLPNDLHALQALIETTKERRAA